MKACPFCAEQIQDAAIVCRFCNRDLPRKERVIRAEDFKPAARLATAKHIPEPPEVRRKFQRRVVMYGSIWVAAILLIWIAAGSPTPDTNATEQGAAVPPSAAEPVVPSAPAAAAPVEPIESDESKCRQELACWGEKHSLTAGSRCRRGVEQLAKYDFEWTDGLLEPKFSHYRWKDPEAGVVTYIGDKIKFTNGFGAKVIHTYECDLDGDTREAVAVRARPGQLPG